MDSRIHGRMSFIVAEMPTWVAVAALGMTDIQGALYNTLLWAGALAALFLLLWIGELIGLHLAAVLVVFAAEALLAVGIPLVVYNAPYDLSLLDRECRRHRVEPLGYPHPVIDPLVIDKAVDRYRKGKRTLVAAAERYGVDLDPENDKAVSAVMRILGVTAMSVAPRVLVELESRPSDDVLRRLAAVPGVTRAWLAP